MKKLLSLLLILLCLAPAALANEADGFKYNYYYSDSDGCVIAIIQGLTTDEQLTELVIPAQLDGYPVKIIGSSAFIGQKKLKSITLPEGLEMIYHFTNAPITTIHLPNSLREIKTAAFISCDASVKQK